MKIGKYLSLISLVVAIVVVFLKLQFDIVTYNSMKEVLASASNGDISPAIVAGGMNTIVLYVVVVITSLVLSLVGMRKKNNYRTFTLAVNILAIIYLIIPVGMLMALE